MMEECNSSPSLPCVHSYNRRFRVATAHNFHRLAGLLRTAPDIQIAFNIYSKVVCIQPTPPQDQTQRDTYGVRRIQYEYTVRSSSSNPVDSAVLVSDRALEHSRSRPYNKYMHGLVAMLHIIYHWGKWHRLKEERQETGLCSFNDCRRGWDALSQSIYGLHEAPQEHINRQLFLTSLFLNLTCCREVARLQDFSDPLATFHSSQHLATGQFQPNLLLYPTITHCRFRSCARFLVETRWQRACAACARSIASNPNTDPKTSIISKRQFTAVELRLFLNCFVLFLFSRPRCPLYYCTTVLLTCCMVLYNPPTLSTVAHSIESRPCKQQHKASFLESDSGRVMSTLVSRKTKKILTSRIQKCVQFVLSAKSCVCGHPSYYCCVITLLYCTPWTFPAR